MNSWNVLYKFVACYLFLLYETGPLVALTFTLTFGAGAVKRPSAEAPWSPSIPKKDGLGDQNLELGDHLVAQYLC